jgi:hypothetical protein
MTLETGDEFIHALLYARGWLWASTRTSPCRVLRIDPDTLQYDRILLPESHNDGEDMVFLDDSVWVILYGTPSRIVRIDVHTLAWETVLSFDPGEFSRGGSLEYAFGYLWAGGGDGILLRIDPRDLTYRVFDYSTALGRLQIHSLSSGGGYLWAAAPIFRITGRRADESIILRINPLSPLEYAAVFLHDAPVSDDMVYAEGHLFAGSESSSMALYRIRSDLTYSSASTEGSGYLGFLACGETVWGALGGSPGMLLRYSVMNGEMLRFALPEGFNNANEIAYDPSRRTLFVSCWESPTRILKIRDLVSRLTPIAFLGQPLRSSTAPVGGISASFEAPGGY